MGVACSARSRGTPCARGPRGGRWPATRSAVPQAMADAGAVPDPSEVRLAARTDTVDHCLVKIVGVLGGMSSVASAEYYRRLNEGVNAHLGGHAAAELLLYSVDFAVIELCVREERWERAADYLVERARRLERGGADFLVLATNTMHRVAPEIEAAVSIPLIHIVDVTADAAIAAGANRLGLLGTAPVMQADFYRSRFAARGIEVRLPRPWRRVRGCGKCQPHRRRRCSAWGTPVPGRTAPGAGRSTSPSRRPPGGASSLLSQVSTSGRVERQAATGPGAAWRPSANWTALSTCNAVVS